MDRPFLLGSCALCDRSPRLALTRAREIYSDDRTPAPRPAPTRPADALGLARLARLAPQPGESLAASPQSAGWPMPAPPCLPPLHFRQITIPDCMPDVSAISELTLPIKPWAFSTPGISTPCQKQLHFLVQIINFGWTSRAEAAIGDSEGAIRLGAAPAALAVQHATPTRGRAPPPYQDTDQPYRNRHGSPVTRLWTRLLYFMASGPDASVTASSDRDARVCSLRSKWIL